MSYLELAKRALAEYQGSGHESPHEEIEVLLDQLDNALRKSRSERTPQALQETRNLEARLAALGASVLIPLGQQGSPREPFIETDVCADIAALSNNPNLVAVAEPGHRARDGEIIGVLRSGCLLGGKVVREAWVIVFKGDQAASEKSEESEESQSPRPVLDEPVRAAPRDIAAELERVLRLGQRLKRGEIRAIWCGIERKPCRDCKGVPCFGSQAMA